ncbi:Putative DNA-binding protein in cluster with Type I restriction-modification system, partial [bacterium endosymbiont of Bathymodiolus sp. 5 South]
MSNKLSIQDELTEFLLYNDGNGDIRVETYLHNETLWLSQVKIAQLFGVQVPAI